MVLSQQQSQDQKKPLNLSLSPSCKSSLVIKETLQTEHEKQGSNNLFPEHQTDTCQIEEFEKDSDGRLSIPDEYCDMTTNQDNSGGCQA